MTKEVDDNELYDVVNAAIEEVGETPTTEDENNDSDEHSEASEDVRGEDESGDVSDGTEEEVVDDEEESESSETDEDDAADGEEDDEAAAGDDDAADSSADDAEGTGDESAVSEDHVNDPIPENLNEKTQGRIKSLIDTVKEKDVFVRERDELLTAITSTGATPDQYAGALTVLKLYNSETPEDKRQALEIVRNMARDLALDLGEGQGVVEVGDYPDLVAEIEAGTLSEERALELATIRAQKKHVETKTAAKRETQQSQEQTQRLVDTGRQDLNDLGAELQADPAYKALYPTFTSVLGPTLRSAHPTEWKAIARDVFARLKAGMPAATPTPTPNPKPKQQPLRPKQGAGGSSNKSAEAGSALDAINEALGGM